MISTAPAAFLDLNPAKAEVFLVVDALGGIEGTCGDDRDRNNPRFPQFNDVFLASCVAVSCNRRLPFGSSLHPLGGFPPSQPLGDWQ